MQIKADPTNDHQCNGVILSHHLLVLTIGVYFCVKLRFSSLHDLFLLLAVHEI